jgi:hypothetical protein
MSEDIRLFRLLDESRAYAASLVSLALRLT